MKEAIIKVKGPIAIIIVLFCLMFLYKTFFVKDDEGLLVQEEVSETRRQIDKDLLPLLSLVRNVNFNGAIFTDPVFQSLTDFSKPIEPEPEGRENPFAGSLMPSKNSSGEVILFSGGTEDTSRSSNSGSQGGANNRSGLPPGDF